MTIVESVMDWLKTCPELADGMLNLDWLPADAREFSLDVVPCDEIIKRFTTGATKRQFLFYIASRAFVGEDIRDAEDNYKFYESFSRWIEHQNAIGNLPDLGEGRAARSVRVSTSGYPMQVSDDGRARYQIQLKMIYVQEAL